MSDMVKFEKINVQEYSPILDKIKYNVITLLEMHNNNINVVKQDEQDQSKIQSELDSLRKLIEEKDRQLLEKEKDISDLRVQIDSERSHNNEVIKDKDFMIEEMKDKNKREMSSNAEKARLRDVEVANLVRTAQEHNDCQTKIQDCYVEIETLKNKLEELGKEKYIEEYEDFKSFVFVHHQNFKSYLDSQSECPSRIISQQDSTEIKNLDLLVEIDQKNKEIKEWKNKYTELEKNLGELRTKTDDSEKPKVFSADELEHSTSCKAHNKTQCKQCGGAVKGYSGGGIFSKLIWSNKTEYPYPLWWRKHMITK